MPYANVNAARIFYEQHGSGEDLIFLHGAGGNHLSWWQQVTAFSPGYRCTVYDARGWGLSRGEMAVGRFSLGTDLVALMDHLGIERAHVVAQSMGGRAVAGLTRLALHARIVICGAISQYNNTTPIKGPANYLSLLVHRATMTSMVVFDYADRYPQAIAELAGYLKDGRMISREDVVAGGVQAFPATLLKLFSGENFGKLVLQIAHP